MIHNKKYPAHMIVVCFIQTLHYIKHYMQYTYIFTDAAILFN